MKATGIVSLALLACLGFAGSGAQARSGDIDAEISRELAGARTEVREELARVRQELQTGNLTLDGSLQLGRKAVRQPGDETDTPVRAEITPDGDLLIEGRAVDLDPAQRRDLIAYRGQVIDIALAGIDIGERSAQVAIDIVDRGLFGLMFGAMTGSLERRIERQVRQIVEPGVVRICRALPELYASQQRLIANLPAFRPYADLEAGDVDNCEHDVRQQLSAL